MTSPPQGLSIHLLSSELASFARNHQSRNLNARPHSKTASSSTNDREERVMFPKSLRTFLRLIPGNDMCPDCSLRKDGNQRGASNHSELCFAK